MIAKLPSALVPPATPSILASMLAGTIIATQAGCFFFHGEAAPTEPPVGSDSLSSTGEPQTSSASSAAFPRPIHPTPYPALLVLAKKDETMAIVDPTTLAVVARVPVGHDPHEVVASTDGRYAYVSNYGRGAYNSLAVVDVEGQHALPAIDLGALRGPHGLRYVGDRVWFTAEGAKSVGSYDPSKHVVDWELGTGQDRTHMLYVTDDTSHLVTTNVSSGTMSFLDRATASSSPRMASPLPGGDWKETVVPVGAGTEGFDVSPSGSEIWAADAQDGAISVIDVATKKVSQRIAAEVVGANRLKITPDGRWALVSSLKSGDLTVFDVHTRGASRRIPVGHGAAGIVVAPDGKRAYVSCSPDGYVAVVDLESWTVTGKIQVGTEPDGIAWATRP